MGTVQDCSFSSNGKLAVSCSETETWVWRAHEPVQRLHQLFPASGGKITSRTLSYFALKLQVLHVHLPTHEATRSITIPPVRSASLSQQYSHRFFASIYLFERGNVKYKMCLSRHDGGNAETNLALPTSDQMQKMLSSKPLWYHKNTS